MMENYIFTRDETSMKDVCRRMVYSDSDYYNQKAKMWIKRHNVGRILKVEVVNNKLMIVSNGIEKSRFERSSRGELNEVNLDDGSISTVFGYIPVLLGKKEFY